MGERERVLLRGSRGECAVSDGERVRLRGSRGECAVVSRDCELFGGSWGERAGDRGGVPAAKILRFGCSSLRWSEEALLRALAMAAELVARLDSLEGRCLCSLDCQRLCTFSEADAGAPDSAGRGAGRSGLTGSERSSGPMLGDHKLTSIFLAGEGGSLFAPEAAFGGGHGA